MKIEGNELIISGVVASIDRDNIDTDQIIPTEYLKSIKKFGFEDYLFDGWRYLDEGKLGISKNDREQNPDFILNQAPFDKATILLTRDNFGCGSSREHAPWALEDYGFRAIIAPSFADIFYNNCFKNGILPITLSSEIVDSLFSYAGQISIDLNNQTVKTDINTYTFEVDPERKRRLINGLDDIGLTLQNESQIRSFETEHFAKFPWL